MAFSSRLFSPTQSSLAKARSPHSSPKSSRSSSPTREKTAKSSLSGGGKELVKAEKNDNGTPKLPQTRNAVRKTSRFVDVLEEKTLNKTATAKDTKNKQVHAGSKFPLKKAFPTVESACTNSNKTKDSSSNEVDMTSGDSDLQAPVAKLNKALSLSTKPSTKEKKVSKAGGIPSVSIDLEELKLHHSWSPGDFPDVNDLEVGENSPVSTLDCRKEIPDSEPVTPVALPERNGFKACQEEEKAAENSSSMEDDVSDYFVNISSELASEIGGSERDLEYVQHVLQISGFGGSKTPGWHSDREPMNPSVFHHLELEIAVGTSFGIDSFQKVNQSDRRQRKLLFDSVNEALRQSLHPFVELKPWVQRKALCARPCPIGCELLEEVWTTIQGWPLPGSDDLFEVLDELSRREMACGPEDWAENGQEQAEVVFELERMLMEEMIDEAIDEFGVVELNKVLNDSDSEDKFPVIVPN